MVMLDFDPSKIEVQERETGEIQVIEPGLYKALITEESDLMDTRSGGKGFVMKWTIVQDGKYKNWRISHFFNLINNNPTAVQISQQALSKIASAVGLPGERDTKKYFAKPHYIKIGTEPDGDKIKNKIFDWSPVSAQQSSMPTATAAIIDDEVPF